MSTTTTTRPLQGRSLTGSSPEYTFVRPQEILYLFRGRAVGEGRITLQVVKPVFPPYKRVCVRTVNDFFETRLPSIAHTLRQPGFERLVKVQRDVAVCVDAIRKFKTEGQHFSELGVEVSAPGGGVWIEWLEVLESGSRHLKELLGPPAAVPLRARRPPMKSPKPRKRKRSDPQDGPDSAQA